MDPVCTKIIPWSHSHIHIINGICIIVLTLFNCKKASQKWVSYMGKHNIYKMFKKGYAFISAWTHTHA